MNLSHISLANLSHIPLWRVSNKPISSKYLKCSNTRRWISQLNMVLLSIIDSKHKRDWEQQIRRSPNLSIRFLTENTKNWANPCWKVKEFQRVFWVENFLHVLLEKQKSKTFIWIRLVWNKRHTTIKWKPTRVYHHNLRALASRDKW